MSERFFEILTLVFICLSGLALLGLAVYVIIRLGSIAWYRTKLQFDRQMYQNLEDYEMLSEEEKHRGKKKYPKESIH